VKYGPDPAKPGDCIRDADPSDGIGRYPQLHGTNKNSEDMQIVMQIVFGI
jgi:hypothetical protein